MNHKITRAEIIWYVIAGVITLVGLIFTILGIIGDHLSYNNWIKTAEAGMLEWRYFGLIFISLGVLIAVIVLCVYAKKYERVTDRATRRAQRLQAMRESSKSEETTSTDK